MKPIHDTPDKFLKPLFYINNFLSMSNEKFSGRF